MGLILATLTGGGDAAAGEPTTPFERAVSTPRGQLKNPYSGLRQRRRRRSQDIPISRLQWLPWRRWWWRHGGTPHQSDLDLWR